jgi:hypothetical protein
MIQATQSMPTPVFSAAPHLVDDSAAIAGWFIEPAGILLQLRSPTRGTTQMAEWVVDDAFARLIERFPGRRNLTVILDMRQMPGRSATARAVLIANAKRVLPRVGRVVLLPSRLIGGEYVRVVEITARMVSAMGLPVEVEHDLQRVFTRHGVRLAAASASEGGTSAPWTV